MGLTHLMYLDDEDQYLVCTECKSHLAAIEQEFEDDITNGGVCSIWKVREL